jgi:hypothetical protein
MVRKGSFSEMLGDREKPKSYHSCAVTAKEPRLLVKELQRMFGENKLLLRASGASFVKGDKNKTRFDIVIYKVSSRVGVLFGDMRCPQAFLLFLFWSVSLLFSSSIMLWVDSYARWWRATERLCRPTKSCTLSCRPRLRAIGRSTGQRAGTVLH